MTVPQELALESFCYLSTIGRVSGNVHTIEIWFALRDSVIYMLAGGRDQADWVRNVMADPRVTVRIATHEFEGAGRIITDPDEDAWARFALVEKYQAGYGGDLTDWGRNSLPVAVDVIS